MDDLAQAFNSDGEMINLGGGNPSQIPAMDSVFRSRLQVLAQSDGGLERVMGVYGGPAGDPAFAQALAALLRRQCGWDVGPENICITNGSQSAFFALFNLLAGPADDGTSKKIMLPMAPEYVGYGDLGLAPDLFVSARPTIEFLDGKLFKYGVDFSALDIGDDIAAVCVSRPTNPTGNVLTDDEVSALRALTRAADIPLILDDAYGAPFPNIIFTDVTTTWDENTILCMSLSKLGLPGIRTGIVIAAEPVVRALSSVNALLSLAPSGMGPAIVHDLVESGEIIQLSKTVIEPHYRTRAEQAAGVLRRELADYDTFVHKPEGSIFLWLWCRGLPVPSSVLYERLKAQGVLVISGEHFFPGLEDDPWPHKHECLRLSYADQPEKVERGLKLVAQQVRRAYDEGAP
ncbi:MAG: valine--pyruvate aminotransferase [Gammaproteobacteria bacterium]|jgi:valine--pyruvate aminotransferase